MKPPSNGPLCERICSFGRNACHISSSLIKAPRRPCPARRGGQPGCGLIAQGGAYLGARSVRPRPFKGVDLLNPSAASSLRKHMAGERNEAEDDLSGSLSSRGGSAVLAVRSLAGGERPEYASVLPATLRQSHRRFFWDGCIRLRCGTPGLRPQ